jgi:hypothetical protein
MNVFNEKIFTIIWFWLVFLTITNLKSVLLTIVRSHFRQFDYSYIANYLNLYSKKERLKRQLLVKRFIFDYLSADGVLILRLVSENISDLLTSEVVNELWNEYKKIASLSTKNREKYLSSQRLKTLQVTTTTGQSYPETTATTTQDIHDRYTFR